MADVNKTIQTDVVLNADKALQEANELVVKIQVLKAELKELTNIKFGSKFGEIKSPELDAQITEITTSLREAEDQLSTLSGTFIDTSATSKSAAGGIRQVGEATEQTKKQTLDFGNVAQRVFRSIVGFLVLNSTIIKRILLWII